VNTLRPTARTGHSVSHSSPAELLPIALDASVRDDWLSFIEEWRAMRSIGHSTWPIARLIVPLIMDNARARRALGPKVFQARQFVHTPGGEMPPQLIERFKTLMGSRA